ncbi:MAG: tetratricopeptide repeat protein [Chitinivibrionales bacterium]|nr:tetratricopeptide repeat protein [Chitinivibrionales bacterium]
MQIRIKLIVYALLACFALTVSTQTVSAETAAERKKRELEAKIRKLQEQKLKRQKQQRTSSAAGEDLTKILARYEKLLASCSGKKSERCADVMFTLAQLYYDQARDHFVQARNSYEKKMDEWERTQRGPEPINPIPDYSKSLNMYRRLVVEYPQFKRSDEANYQIGSILLLAGEMDSSRMAFESIVNNSPGSVRASAAHFRLADFCYMDFDHACALKHLEKVKRDEVNIEVWEMVHYRKAELYYNRAEFDRAIDLFFTYVERCDAGEYVKRQFREEALEFMAISFSDMDEGAAEAINFFKRKGSRPYEAYVIYTIGFKNRDHGQFDDAILALTTALQNYPFYKDAPIAQHKLVECYVVKKEHDKANENRIKLVDNYWEGSEWYSKNSQERAIIDQAKVYVKKALSNICIFYHATAQKKKDRSVYEKALKRYLEFFKKFPGDKWKTYEFKYNVAEIYNDLQMYDKAVENYWFIATEDLGKYPDFQVEDPDSLLYDDPKEYEEAKKKARESGPMAISQADAGYNAIVALNKLRKKSIAKQGLDDKQAYTMAATKQMLDYCKLYREKFPKHANTPEVIYLAGNIHYLADAWDKAVAQFQFIVDNFPQAKIADNSFRMLAKSYSSAGEFDMALKKYQELLSRTDPKLQDYFDIQDLAAGTMYNKAEKMRKDGNYMGAADVFRNILSSFPKSKIADRGWFEAGVCYEDAKSYDLAASAFEQLPVKFTKSTLREKSFVRAAENYKKMKKWELAAGAYAKGAQAIPKADFAIPSLSSAADCYDSAGNADMAGKMNELIFERYADDSRAPQALYTAGYIYEKGKIYHKAIKAYLLLSEKYPKSEFSEDAGYSIGICYEKQDKWAEAANAFMDFAKKFENKAKQVEALKKAGDAYKKVNDIKGAENAYLSATTLYEKFKKKAEFNIGTIAKAYAEVGAIYQKEYASVKLTGRRERDVKKQVKEKEKALKKVLEQYAKAIETGVEDAVLKSTWLIGQAYVDFAEALANQKLFGSQEQRIASRIRIVSSLEKYYDKAQEKFYWNINKAREQNLTGEYIDRSIESFMEMAYRKGRLFEMVGEIFAGAPIPRGLAPEEERAYKEILEEKKLEAMDKSLPKYIGAMKAASDLGIAKSSYLDSIRSRISIIDPTSEWLTKEITAWTPDASPEANAATVEEGEVSKSVAKAEEAPSNETRADPTKMHNEMKDEPDDDSGEKKKERRKKRRKRR